MHIIRTLILFIRSGVLNLFYFHTLSKRIIFGKNVNVEGKVSFAKNITLDDNVEIRNRTQNCLQIGNYTSINRNTVIRGKVKIGDNVAIAPNCMIIGASHRFDALDKPINKQGFDIKGIEIESDVWIGANCCILDGVTIGAGSVIGAGSIVTKSIPKQSVAVGNPCRVIRKR